MKIEITNTMFHDAFMNANRLNNFSYEGRNALFEMLEQYEEDCGTEIELDVVALCCEFSEYDSALDCINDCGYSCTFEEGVDDDEKEDAAFDYLQENTMVYVFNGGIIIQDF